MPNTRKHLSYYLPYAEVEWQDIRTPYSPEFDDIYWSQNNGLGEKQHVFIDATQLAHRWQQLKPGEKFTIVETGFGFGLNFLLTLKLWLETPACKDARLEYIAFEQYLVRPADLSKMVASFPLGKWLEKLLRVYPLPIPGTHPCWVADNVRLSLNIGAIEERLPTLETQVDACFLDGFSPANNHDMWSNACLAHIVKQLSPGAIMSSYTVAGIVRRSLTDQGLKVEKGRGFGSKREMLLATKPGTWQAAEPAKSKAGSIVIVGAGLAGIACANALQRRGLEALIIDQSNLPLGTAAPFPQLAVYPQLSKTPQPYSQFYLNAFQYFENHTDYHANGRLELLYSEVEAQRAGSIAERAHLHCHLVTAKEASGIAGILIKHPALYYPNAGWVNPQTSNSIVSSLMLNTSLNSIERRGDNWLLTLTDGTVQEADTVIFATGYHQLELLQPLGLLPLRGQGLLLEQPKRSPMSLVAGKKTWFPEYQGISTLTGTFERGSIDTNPSNQSQLELLKSLEDAFDMQTESYEDVVGIRATTRDRLPVIGNIPDWDALNSFCDLRPIEQYQGFKDYLPQLFTSVGFGSHGATLAPLCGEIIAGKIAGDNSVVAEGLLAAYRFKLRDQGIKLPGPKLAR